MSAVLENGGKGEGRLAEEGLGAAGGDGLVSQLK